MAELALRIVEPRSGLDVTAELLAGRAPENVAFLRAYLAETRVVPSLHAMWTGPEISSPIPAEHVRGEGWARPLPPENATLTPQPGDVVLSYVPARMWGGNPDPIFDIGLFYGAGARMLFPIGWLAGSVVAQVRAEQRAALAEWCGVMRRYGACEVGFSLV
jgi:hypothetical protein